MGTNHSFLMQIWVFLGCCGSLQHNICKSLVIRVVVVAKRRCRKNNVKKCENNLDIRKSVCIFAVQLSKKSYGKEFTRHLP